MRTIIDLPADQLDALDGICRRESISRAEAIRRAVDLLVRDRAAGGARTAFGLWRGTGTLDGLTYQQRLRQEWGSSLPSRHRASRKRTK
jgi:hypothetical protein